MRKAVKGWLIAAAALIATGSVLFVGGMAAMDWDFLKLNTETFTTETHTVTETFTDTVIDTDVADVCVVPAEDGVCRVECSVAEGVTHEVKVRDGVLTVTVKDGRAWYQRIGILFTAPKIVVHLPQEGGVTVTVKNATGSVDMRALTIDTLDLTTATGRVTLQDISCAQTAQVHFSTGAVEVDALRCGSLTVKGATGSVTLRDTVAAQALVAATSTGGITLDGCDAATLQLSSQTGSVTGRLLTAKTFRAQSYTGDVDVPDTEGGLCEITVGTGSIRMTVSAEG